MSLENRFITLENIDNVSSWKDISEKIIKNIEQYLIDDMLVFMPLINMKRSCIYMIASLKTKLCSCKITYTEAIGKMNVGVEKILIDTIYCRPITLDFMKKLCPILSNKKAVGDEITLTETNKFIYSIFLKNEEDENRYATFTIQEFITDITPKANRNLIQQSVLDAISKLRTQITQHKFVPILSDEGWNYVGSDLQDLDADIEKLISKPMLAYDAETVEDFENLCNRKKAGIKFPVMIQPKLDGVRSMVYKDTNGNICMTSRGGKSQKIVEKFVEELTQIYDICPGEDRIVFDGEIYCHGYESNEINGAISSYGSATQSSKSAEISKKLEYVIFGIIILNRPEVDAISRFDFLENIRLFGVNFKTINIIRADICHTCEQVIEFYHKYHTLGYEGIMCYQNVPYMPTRGKHLLKLKYYKIDDFPIVDVVEAKGSEKDMALFVISRMEHLIQLRPNMTNEERKKILNEKDAWIGRIATVKYYGLTSKTVGKNTGGLLRHPTLVSVSEI